MSGAENKAGAPGEGSGELRRETRNCITGTRARDGSLGESWEFSPGFDVWWEEEEKKEEMKFNSKLRPLG